MQQFVNWEYYNSLYPNADPEEFAVFMPLAEKEVSIVVGIIRFAHIDEDTFGLGQLKDCICFTTNRMIENSKSGKGKGVSSVSNDGYSESYVVQTEDQLRTELHTSIKSWLSGTGLVGAY